MSSPPPLIKHRLHFEPDWKTSINKNLEIQVVSSQILEAFQYRGNIDSLAKGIMHVYVDDKTINEVN